MWCYISRRNKSFLIVLKRICGFQVMLRLHRPPHTCPHVPMPPNGCLSQFALSTRPTRNHTESSVHIRSALDWWLGLPVSSGTAARPQAQIPGSILILHDPSFEAPTTRPCTVVFVIKDPFQPALSAALLSLNLFSVFINSRIPTGTPSNRSSPSSPSKCIPVNPPTSSKSPTPPSSTLAFNPIPLKLPSFPIPPLPTLCPLVAYLCCPLSFLLLAAAHSSTSSLYASQTQFTHPLMQQLSGSGGRANPFSPLANPRILALGPASGVENNTLLSGP